MTLADDYTNSIQTDEDNRVIPSNVAIQVAPHVAKFGINAICITWTPNLEPMAVAPHFGKICD